MSDASLAAVRKPVLGGSGSALVRSQSEVALAPGARPAAAGAAADAEVSSSPASVGPATPPPRSAVPSSLVRERRSSSAVSFDSCEFCGVLSMTPHTQTEQVTLVFEADGIRCVVDGGGDEPLFAHPYRLIRSFASETGKRFTYRLAVAPKAPPDNDVVVTLLTPLAKQAHQCALECARAFAARVK